MAMEAAILGNDSEQDYHSLLAKHDRTGAIIRTDRNPLGGNRQLIVSRLVTRTLQRYWRVSRGLSLEVRAVVRDAGGRVLLLREAPEGPWQLPGGAVTAGETAEEAVVRILAERCQVSMTGPAHLFAIYADIGSTATAQIALYNVPSWRQPRPEPSQLSQDRVNLFSAGALPANLEPASRKRIGDVIAHRQGSQVW